VLGYDQPPAKLPFELVVDTVDPATGGIVQQLAFDPPWAGWIRYAGSLVFHS